MSQVHGRPLAYGPNPLISIAVDSLPPATIAMLATVAVKTHELKLACQLYFPRNTLARWGLYEAARARVDDLASTTHRNIVGAFDKVIGELRNGAP